MACTDGEKKATNFTADASPTLDKIMVVADPNTGELLRTTIDEWEKNSATRAIVNATPDLINGLITFDASSKEWQQTTIEELFQNLSTKASDDDSPELDAQLYYADDVTGELKRLTISELFTRLGITVNTDGSGTILNTPLSFGSPVEVTISSGSITASSSYHMVGSEGGAATDDLDTINGGYDGYILVLRSFSNSQDITIKDEDGNLNLDGDFTLTDRRDTITLMYDEEISLWIEISRSNNQFPE